MCVSVCVHMRVHARVYTCMRVHVCVHACVFSMWFGPSRAWAATIWSNGERLCWTQGAQPQKRKSITKELCLDSYGAWKEYHFTWTLAS